MFDTSNVVMKTVNMHGKHSSIEYYKNIKTKKSNQSDNGDRNEVEHKNNNIKNKIRLV